MGVQLAEEIKIQNAIIAWLKLSGVFCWRNNSGGVYDPVRKQFRSPAKYHLNGVPDILGILPGGRMLAIEVKTPSGAVRETQKEFLQTAAALGALCGICRSVDDAQTLLSDFIPDKRNH